MCESRLNKLYILYVLLLVQLQKSLARDTVVHNKVLACRSGNIYTADRRQLAWCVVWYIQANPRLLSQVTRRNRNLGKFSKLNFFLLLTKVFPKLGKKKIGSNNILNRPHLRDKYEIENKCIYTVIFSDSKVVRTRFQLNSFHSHRGFTPIWGRILNSISTLSKHPIYLKLR